MITRVSKDSTQRDLGWCIVVADGSSPTWTSSAEAAGQPLPIQYCCIDEPVTLLQRALHRATNISCAARILVTVEERDRAQWQPALWFIRSQHRFVADDSRVSSLTLAAAVLSIAARSPLSVVTIMSARCYVANERVLSAALHHAIGQLRRFPDVVFTLGMDEVRDAVDEYFLMPGTLDAGPGEPVSAMARYPIVGAARHVANEGAMVASSIYVGCAGVLASLIIKNAPGLARQLARRVLRPSANPAEVRLSVDLRDAIPSARMRSFWWCPLSFPLRALRVTDCGWSGLHSVRAVERAFGTPAYAGQRQRTMAVEGSNSTSALASTLDVVNVAGAGAWPVSIASKSVT
jgi:mannose-1-phosphate guanylyltransferase